MQHRDGVLALERQLDGRSGLRIQPARWSSLRNLLFSSRWEEGM